MVEKQLWLSMQTASLARSVFIYSGFGFYL